MPNEPKPEQKVVVYKPALKLPADILEDETAKMLRDGWRVKAISFIGHTGMRREAVAVVYER